MVGSSSRITGKRLRRAGNPVGEAECHPGRPEYLAPAGLTIVLCESCYHAGVHYGLPRNPTPAQELAVLERIWRLAELGEEPQRAVSASYAVPIVGNGSAGAVAVTPARPAWRRIERADGTFQLLPIEDHDS